MYLVNFRSSRIFPGIVVALLLLGYGLEKSLAAESENNAFSTAQPQGDNAAVDRSNAVKITADRVEFNRHSGTSIYSGNVALTQGQLSLRARSLEVFTANKRLAKITAKGSPAVFESVLDDGRPVVGEANSVEFNVRDETLMLTGEGRLLQGENSIENDHIVYSLKTDSLKAGGEESSRRVEVILLPAE